MSLTDMMIMLSKDFLLNLHFYNDHEFCVQRFIEQINLVLYLTYSSSLLLYLFFLCNPAVNPSSKHGLNLVTFMLRKRS